MEFNKNDYNTISLKTRSIIMIPLDILSIIGTALIIYFYKKIPELQTFGNKILLYISCSLLVYLAQITTEDIL